jgi:hypothetical protein
MTARIPEASSGREVPALTLPGEEWRPVIGYAGLYEASSLGRVRCPDKQVARGAWSVFRHGRVLAQHVDPQGYLRVNLSRDSVKVCVRTHQVVAAAFIGPRSAGAHTRHLDGDCLNNRASNLAYGTAQDNADDEVRLGRTARGERNASAKLSERDVVDIRLQRAAGVSIRTLGKRFGVADATIVRAARGESWLHVAEASR